MIEKRYDIAIIGAGLAGLTAAIEADKLGKSVILFEKNVLGGLAFNGGDIILKNLFKALKDELKKERLNVENILTFVAQQKELFKNDYLNVLNTSDKITIILAEAKLESDNKISANGRSYYADKIILAYGASFNKPNIKGIEEGLKSGFVKTSKELLNLSFKEKSILIYGGGKVAVEFAIFLANLGIEVYLFSRSTFLKDIDEDAKAHYFNLISLPNLHISDQTELTEFTENAVYYQKNEEITKLKVDQVILATGVKPNLKPLNNQEFKHNNKGLIVDENMQTSKTNIYAIGDVNQFSKYSNLAISEALVAINHLAFQKYYYEEKRLIKNSSGLIQYSFVGLSEKELLERNIPYEKRVITFDPSLYDLYFFKILIHKTTREILRLLVISKDSNKDINEIIQMLKSEVDFAYNNKNNLFSDTFQINRLLKKEFVSIDNELIENKHQVYYQPKVKAKTHEVIGAELLSRFKIDGRIVNPLPFINSFEKHHTIINLDLKMLTSAASFLKDLLAGGVVSDQFKFSVNFSPLTLNIIKPNKLAEIVKKFSLLPNRFIIELTERSISDKAINFQHLKALKAEGFHLSMDDFSVGHSSLELLNKINFSEVKLDISLLPKGREEKDEIAIFDNLAKIVATKNKKAVAEGVETKIQADFLDERNLDAYQGYYFSKPLSKIDFILYLKNKNGN
ncbi:MAG: FAD-dependent oxidoreductase [Acholeplasmatales bacterium]|jgi:dihydrolipoamide dehydrogenase|nr:FAD-dependent oxidoreductase [Acholeplasmataceae bacterium]MCK9427838.1 FAD-dependent oxidoreductase [Acholeplasmataceae bacterium]MDY0115231.1 FAD-dependent oxidoreductase [Acholeplasmatales bacterium]HHT38886.1 FAD-dependent oxidoreductase [Acholeplasmataceae bacterium]